MHRHRKRLRHYHESGDCHELTFSCYRRLPLLANDFFKRLLCTSIDRATGSQQFRLVAFVLMPEHVHLLVYPVSADPKIDRLLQAIKRPVSYRIKSHLEKEQSSLLDRLTIRERPGKMTFRFWQEGAGYDRNLSQEQAALSAIDYIWPAPHFLIQLL